MNTDPRFIYLIFMKNNICLNHFRWTTIAARYCSKFLKCYHSYLYEVLFVNKPHKAINLTVYLDFFQDSCYFYYLNPCYYMSATMSSNLNERLWKVFIIPTCRKRKMNINWNRKFKHKVVKKKWHFEAFTFKFLRINHLNILAIAHFILFKQVNCLSNSSAGSFTIKW